MPRDDRLVARVPGGLAELVAVLVDELAGLDLAEDFLGVAADVGGVDLTADDPAVGIDDEGAAFGFVALRGQDVELAGQVLGGVADHWKFDFADGLGVVVPRLVHEDGVAGDLVDLAADLLKVLVVVLQVLKLRRADEREVRRIEEKYAPLVAKVVLRDRNKRVIQIRRGGKILHLFINQSHNRHSLDIRLLSPGTHGLAAQQTPLQGTKEQALRPAPVFRMFNLPPRASPRDDGESLPRACFLWVSTL